MLSRIDVRAFATVPLCLLFCAPDIRAAAPQTVERAGTFTVYFENDLFAGTDRYYTNGVKVSWSSPDLERFADTRYAKPLLPILDRLTFIGEQTQKNLVFSIGQNIYTPDDTEAFDLVRGDRPYAGWLYFGLGLVWKNAQFRQSLLLDIGVVGSWSYAEEAQRIVHETRDLAVPKGWDNQLHNELGVVGTYQITTRWPHHERRVGFDWELLPHAGLSLGNVLTSAQAGAELRAGFNLPDDFGTDAIGPAAATPTPVTGSQGAERAHNFDLGFYLFTRAEGRAVAHNIFLDGSTFGSSPSVDRKWFVADVSVGAAINYRNTKLTYALVYRTKEFYGQDEGQLFGSVSVNFAF
jgi:hypothetical protein